MYLNGLVKKSIYILREAKARFENPAVLWSTGKDSTTVLSLMREAFYGEILWPVIHIDTEQKFKEIYEFRDRMVEDWNLELVVAKNTQAIRKGVSPETVGRFDCCTELKTKALQKLIETEGYDAIIVSIRRDEHGIRNIERHFSPRTSDFEWLYKDQPAELWSLYQTRYENVSHVRVHPILDWTELDVWHYVKDRHLPLNPLYFSRNGYRYRSLGCKPCTVPIRSNASTIDEIIEELKTTDIKERDGRAQDKEQEYIMERLRALGYM